MDHLVGRAARVINDGAFIKCPAWCPAKKSNLHCHMMDGRWEKRHSLSQVHVPGLVPDIVLS